ncbi:Flagellar P-ring protein [Nitrosococcus oceani ATCC 19707]|uniref:Flagellar P-ring protein n=2 Tax=Nitrosococcus oceani TaxID=1229 RepID=FLGI_NITOC|nr:flagellar basal body P-ring protein FlgI [Nitrosococcus oceani]Q3J8L7.1 RecName: Full=Flagellar P-ring protein; AltName: Full=Basal body P-ring protein; Flags: Precursor [Nitrosococcus oceani ATCC 19707]KFI18630.1 flagellar P-ring protein FlgI [Nitrosococcus oceani C-27]ABA58829.1 Flagellar P-ring protein [Nitrosococcus oceani ATCC 19707]EDZ67066.1 flagellar P-ring protein FlgI [Nitrosococcus oceani AFC27]GEM19080.1 flagellar P-ring protein [Nitrosococcus oceani]
MKIIQTFFIITLLWLSQGVQAERVKDLAAIAGVRSNQLVGYGLVVGLSGTGDQVTQISYTRQSLRNMLREFGIIMPPGVNLQPKNVAAVSIHAQLPPFAKPGQSIDITVSSLGNAKSLRGGSLLLTPLKGADGRVYAMAQGNLIVGGFGAEGNDGSRVTVNIPSTGRIPNGATVERGVPNPFNNGGPIILNLHAADFTTANRVAAAINSAIGAGTARPLDGASIQVNAPAVPAQRVSFVSLLENLEVDPGEAPAKIVINSRTGTVVIGQHVRVQPAAVSHGRLTVTITANPAISQPPPLSGGQTAVVPRTDIDIQEEGSRMFLFAPGVSLGEIVRAVNQVGAAPGDLVAILEALKQVGALSAELVVL